MYASYEEDKKHRSSEKWDTKYDGMRMVSKAKSPRRPPTQVNRNHFQL